MSDNITRSVLTDELISLANVFKESGLNPPKKIIVDGPTFDRLISESMMLYNIDSKKAISEREFSLSDIMRIAEDGATREDTNQSEEYNQQKPSSTKYECPDCRIIFENKLEYRKHHQAFHDSIKQPNLLQ
jgi:SpoVK/Ycf46/Vps4 family AAA+-type ATPase